MTDLKKKLKNREFVAGTHTTLIDTSITELYGFIGFDFVWIDTEHTSIDYYALQNHIIAAAAGGTNSLVRIPWNDPVMAKRVLEMGPTGIIFPMVSNAEELDRAMQSTLYPPLGIRGWGPRRAVKYGVADANKYISEKSLEMVRCAQIESHIAVDNLEEMAKNPYVDCFIIGPCDLSGSVGELNQIFNKKTQDLVKRSIEILGKAGKSVGLSTGSDNPAELKAWHDLGLNFLSAGADILHITKNAGNILACMKEMK